jgi:hypothetical protein
MGDRWDALIELATKIAELPAPDRDMDVLVWQAIDPEAPKNLLSWTPEFTQIIDDALKVVPFGPHWRWLLDKRPYADSGRPDGYRAHVTLSGLIDPRDTEVWAAVPAIALTAAALRGRAFLTVVKPLGKEIEEHPF